MSKPTIEQIKTEYHQNDICMGELLADIPADSLSLEEAFELYIEAMKWAEGDRFFKQEPDGELIEI